MSMKRIVIRMPQGEQGSHSAIHGIILSVSSAMPSSEARPLQEYLQDLRSAGVLAKEASIMIENA